MVNKIEDKTIKIDQDLFKRLYNSAILKIPDKLRREGTSKNHPDYNKVLKTTIELFLSKNGLIKTILEKPDGDAKALFDNIYNRLKISKTGNIPAPSTKEQRDLFETI